MRVPRLLITIICINCAASAVSAFPPDSLADAHKLMDEQKYQEAREVVEAMSHYGEQMSRVQEASSIGGERSFWNRSFRALEVGACELRGRLALAGPKAGYGSAYNWFRSAVDQFFSGKTAIPLCLPTGQALIFKD